MFKIFSIVLSCFTIITNQECYSNDLMQNSFNQEIFNKNKQLYDEYKKLKENSYIEVLKEYNFIKLYNMYEMDFYGANIVNIQHPDEDKYYKLKIIFNNIELETWKYLCYKEKRYNIIEFYTNTIKLLQDLQNNYSNGEYIGENGVIYIDNTNYRFDASVKFSIERCSNILEIYKEIDDKYKNTLNKINENLTNINNSIFKV